MASKIFFTAIIFILIAFIALSADDPQATGSKLPFDIGDTLPDSIVLDSCFGLSFSPISSFIPMLCPVIIDGVEYCFEISNELSWIKMIVVFDSLFVSPEGLRIGQEFGQALSKCIHLESVGQPFYQICARLPSGWYAAAGYWVPPDDTTGLAEDTIEFFFKYGRDPEVEEN